MNRAVWMFAALLLAVDTYAEPGDNHLVSFAANPGLSCARFIGSFNEAGYQGVWEAKPILKCNLVEKKGSFCVLTEHGIPNVGPIKFEGKFGWDEGKFLVVGQSQVLMLRLICSEPGSCPLVQVWNTGNFYGFSCDMHPIHAPIEKPVKPEAPKPPTELGNKLSI